LIEDVVGEEGFWTSAKTPARRRDFVKKVASGAQIGLIRPVKLHDERFTWLTPILMNVGTDQ
jgi:hypothetical protein